MHNVILLSPAQLAAARRVSLRFRLRKTWERIRGPVVVVTTLVLASAAGWAAGWMLP